LLLLHFGQINDDDDDSTSLKFTLDLYFFYFIFAHPLFWAFVHFSSVRYDTCQPDSLSARIAGTLQSRDPAWHVPHLLTALG